MNVAVDPNDTFSTSGAMVTKTFNEWYVFPILTIFVGVDGTETLLLWIIDSPIEVVPTPSRLSSKLNDNAHTSKSLTLDFIGKNLNSPTEPEIAKSKDPRSFTVSVFAYWLRYPFEALSWIRDTISNCLSFTNLVSFRYIKYFLLLKSVKLNVSKATNAVGLGVLLNKGLTSSIETTLFPTDSLKSESTLLLKTISSDNTDVWSKLILFSLPKSKSWTQFISTYSSIP